jgi:membrane-bound metal-dependent hydrolase YbcI (DUF457 family)
MAHFRQHAITGGCCGAAVYLVHFLQNDKAGQPRPFDVGQLLGCVGAGVAAGVLPDLLEPANTPNHRAFFHSILFAVLAAYLILGYDYTQMPWSWRLLIFAVTTAYGSHLYLDSITPMGLPLHGLKW